MTTGKVKSIGKKTKTALKVRSSSGGICTATEVCKIIKACKDSGVATFSFNGLSLTFVRENLEESAIRPATVAQTEEISNNNIDYLDEEDIAEQHTYDMEEMKIVDPLGYEKFLREEDVNHA